MRWRNVWVVYRKELLDLIRDRKTVLSMVLFPLIGFPIMTVGFNRLEEKLREKTRAETSTIMILGEQNSPEIAQSLRQDPQLEIVPPADDYVQRINNKKLRAAVEFPPDLGKSLETRGAEIPKIKIYFYDTETRSENARRVIERVLREYRTKTTEARLESLHLPVHLLDPVQAKAENVASAVKVTGTRFGMILPYFIIIFCLMGTMHPAMDLTAGEKERGTLETILASAVSRSELIVGKFFLVLSSSLFTATMALASLALSMRLNPSKQGAFQASAGYSLGPTALVVIFLLVLPMAILFSAVLLAISALAKSYKEAQSYAGPLMIFAIFPAVVSIIPGVELRGLLAVIPIVNVSLVAKDAFIGVFAWKLIAIVFLSTWIYAAVALAVAVLQFQREEVLFRS